MGPNPVVASKRTMNAVRRKRTYSADLSRLSSQNSMTLVTLLEPLAQSFGEEVTDTQLHALQRTKSCEMHSLQDHRHETQDDGHNQHTDARKRRRHRPVKHESREDAIGSSSFLMKVFVVAAVICAFTSSGLLILFWRNGVALRDNHETWLKSVASDIYEYYARKEGGVVKHPFSLWPYYLHDTECCNEPSTSIPDDPHHLWESDPNFVAPRYRTSLQQANYFDQDADQDQRPHPERAAEASSALRAAIDMSAAGKHAKAMRVFQHALALVDDDPEILIAYGEFLEKYENNYVEADHLYTRALVISPLNTRAVANKRRTSPLVADLDFEVLKRIDSKRDELAKLPDTNAALRRIKKEAYFQYVYHTVGIEGNTMTLSETRSVLETRIAVGGKSVMEHNEILGMDAALRFVNQSLLHRIGAITVDDILSIHRRVMGVVDPDVAGTYRKSQVFVSKHIPPPADRVPALMDDLVAWLNSPAALEAHPLHYAALAHYKLVYIHPFVDGNGRTARLFMNWILMQEGYPPVIIRKQDRMKYYETLQATNEGDVKPFMRFIADCAEKTLEVYLWATREVPDRALQALTQAGSLKDDFEEEQILHGSS